jgi:hypothetical protein
MTIASAGMPVLAPTIVDDCQRDIAPIITTRRARS